MRKIVFASLMLVLFVLFEGCKKGDTGEQGPQGNEGLQGPRGAQGSTGTANVIYSDWLSTTAGEWKDTTLTNFTRSQRVFKTASALTQPVLDSGVVMVYLRDAFNTTYSLPLTYNVSPSRVHNFIPMVGKFLFFEYATDGSGGFVVLTNKYRYIIIPGGVKTGGRLKNWQSMNYKEVCLALGIPE